MDNSSSAIPGVEAFQRMDTKWVIDATKPAAMTMPDERARFGTAVPLNFAKVDVMEFLS